MKKYSYTKYLFLGALFLALISCGGESEQSEVTPTPKVGENSDVKKPIVTKIETPVKEEEPTEEEPIDEDKVPLETLNISYDNANLVYEGRVIKNSSLKATELFWPGTSITLDFEGVSVKATFDDKVNPWKGSENAHFNIFVDGEFKKILKLTDGKKSYDIISDLEDGKHTLEITKRNESLSGRAKFYGFEISGRETFPREKKKLFIEFYGDSVTAGLGNEDPTKADAISNNYWAYGAITARNLNAEYSCIARSGIGLMVSWFDLIMPEMYDFENPYNRGKKWDFSKKQPDIVVINILQNDSWIVNAPDNDQFKNRFGATAPTEQEYINAYVDFVNTIKGRYPNTKIICMLGNMDITKAGSIWPGRVQKAVDEFSKDVYFLNSPHIQANGHPKVAEHKKSAELLTNFINKNIL